MHWIAPSEKDTEAATLDKRLWDAAAQFHANSGLVFSQFAQTC
jgi:type I restriction enzyme M protein